MYVSAYINTHIHVLFLFAANWFISLLVVKQMVEQSICISQFPDRAWILLSLLIFNSISGFSKCLFCFSLLSSSVRILNNLLLFLQMSALSFSSVIFCPYLEQYVTVSRYVSSVFLFYFLLSVSYVAVSLASLVLAIPYRWCAVPSIWPSVRHTVCQFMSSFIHRKQYLIFLSCFLIFFLIFLRCNLWWF